MADSNAKIDFKSTVVDKKLCSITMDIEVSSDAAGKEIESVFNEIQKSARIDGFRQGKAPISMVKDKYSQEAKDKAIENIVKGTVFDALEKKISYL